MGASPELFDFECPYCRECHHHTEKAKRHLMSHWMPGALVMCPGCFQLARLVKREHGQLVTISFVILTHSQVKALVASPATRKLFEAAARYRRAAHSFTVDGFVLNCKENEALS